MIYWLSKYRADKKVDWFVFKNLLNSHWVFACVCVWSKKAHILFRDAQWYSHPIQGEHWFSVINLLKIESNLCTMHMDSLVGVATRETRKIIWTNQQHPTFALSAVRFSLSVVCSLPLLHRDCHWLHFYSLAVAVAVVVAVVVVLALPAIRFVLHSQFNEKKFRGKQLNCIYNKSLVNMQSDFSLCAFFSLLSFFFLVLWPFPVTSHLCLS